MMKVKGTSCCFCRSPSTELIIKPCACTLHARCAPTHLFVAPSTISSSSEKTQLLLLPTQPDQLVCPNCKSDRISEIELMPETLTYLDQAVEIKKANNKNASESNPKEATSTYQDHPESPYLLLLASKGVASFAPSNEYQRTGRWTNEEMEFVDFLINAFDNGCLALPPDLRLIDFLCQMFVCKPSRLTKKIKNARLSTRTYEIKTQAPNLDYEKLATLQEKFFISIQDEVDRILMRYIVERTWRTNLANMCIQLRSSVLNATNWIASLDMIEQRGALAEENIRKDARRSRNIGNVGFSRPPHATKPAPLSKTINESQSKLTDNHRNMTTTFAGDRKTNFAGDSNITHKTVADQACLPILEDLVDLDDNRAREEEISSPNRHFMVKVIQSLKIHNFCFDRVDVWQQTTSNTGGGPDIYLSAIRNNESGQFSILEPGNQTESTVLQKSLMVFNTDLHQRVVSSGQPVWKRWNMTEISVIYKNSPFQTSIGIPVFSTTSSFITGEQKATIIIHSYSVITQVDTDAMEKIMIEFSKLDIPIQSDKHHCHHRQYSSVASSQSLNDDKHSIPVIKHESKSVTAKATATTVPLVDACHHNCLNFDSPPKDDRDEEMRIAMLLGSHMPSTGMINDPRQDNNNFLPDFMSLRLLLLQSPEHRSYEQNNLLDVIRQSYRCCLRMDSMVSTNCAVIARQLAMDWRYLRFQGTTVVNNSYHNQGNNNNNNVASKNQSVDLHSLSTATSKDFSLTNKQTNKRFWEETEDLRGDEIFKKQRGSPESAADDDDSRKSSLL